MMSLLRVVESSVNGAVYRRELVFMCSNQSGKCRPMTLFNSRLNVRPQSGRSPVCIQLLRMFGEHTVKLAIKLTSKQRQAMALCSKLYKLVHWQQKQRGDSKIWVKPIETVDCHQAFTYIYFVKTEKTLIVSKTIRIPMLMELFDDFLIKA